MLFDDVVVVLLVGVVVGVDVGCFVCGESRDVVSMVF